MQEAPLEHLAAAVSPRRRRHAGRALQSNVAVAQRLEGVQVATRPAAEIQQVKGQWPREVLQQRRDVLANVVVARAIPVALCVLLAVRQGARGDPQQVFGAQWHATSFHAETSSTAGRLWQRRRLEPLIPKRGLRLALGHRAGCLCTPPMHNCIRSLRSSQFQRPGCRCSRRTVSWPVARNVVDATASCHANELGQPSGLSGGLEPQLT